MAGRVRNCIWCRRLPECVFVVSHALEAKTTETEAPVACQRPQFELELWFLQARPHVPGIVPSPKGLSLSLSLCQSAPLHRPFHVFRIITLGKTQKQFQDSGRPQRNGGGGKSVENRSPGRFSRRGHGGNLIRGSEPFPRGKQSGGNRLRNFGLIAG